MKSNHSKKRRLNNNTFRKNTRIKRKNMTKKDKKKPKLSRKISRIQRGGDEVVNINQHLIVSIGGLTEFLKKARHEYTGEVIITRITPSELDDLPTISYYYEKILDEFTLRKEEEERRATINNTLFKTLKEDIGPGSIEKIKKTIELKKKLENKTLSAISIYSYIFFKHNLKATDLVKRIDGTTIFEIIHLVIEDIYNNYYETGGDSTIRSVYGKEKKSDETFYNVEVELPIKFVEKTKNFKIEFPILFQNGIEILAPFIDYNDYHFLLLLREQLFEDCEENIVNTSRKYKVTTSLELIKYFMNCGEGIDYSYYNLIDELNYEKKTGHINYILERLCFTFFHTIKKTPQTELRHKTYKNLLKKLNQNTQQLKGGGESMYDYSYCKDEFTEWTWDSEDFRGCMAQLLKSSIKYTILTGIVVGYFSFISAKTSVTGSVRATLDTYTRIINIPGVVERWKEERKQKTQKKRILQLTTCDIGSQKPPTHSYGNELFYLNDYADILQAVTIGTGNLKKGPIKIFTTPNLNNKNSDLDTYQVISEYVCNKVVGNDPKKHYYKCVEDPNYYIRNKFTYHDLSKPFKYLNLFDINFTYREYKNSQPTKSILKNCIILFDDKTHKNLLYYISEYPPNLEIDLDKEQTLMNTKEEKLKELEDIFYDRYTNFRQFEIGETLTDVKMEKKKKLEEEFKQTITELKKLKVLNTLKELSETKKDTDKIINLLSIISTVKKKKIKFFEHIIGLTPIGEIKNTPYSLIYRDFELYFKTFDIIFNTKDTYMHTTEPIKITFEIEKLLYNNKIEPFSKTKNYFESKTKIKDDKDNALIHKYSLELKKSGLIYKYPEKNELVPLSLKVNKFEPKFVLNIYHDGSDENLIVFSIQYGDEEKISLKVGLDKLSDILEETPEDFKSNAEFEIKFSVMFKNTLKEKLKGKINIKDNTKFTAKIGNISDFPDLDENTQDVNLNIYIDKFSNELKVVGLEYKQEYLQMSKAQGNNYIKQELKKFNGEHFPELVQTVPSVSQLVSDSLEIVIISKIEISDSTQNKSIIDVKNEIFSLKNLYDLYDNYKKKFNNDIELKFYFKKIKPDVSEQWNEKMTITQSTSNDSVVSFVDVLEVLNLNDQVKLYKLISNFDKKEINKLKEKGRIKKIKFIKVSNQSRNIFSLTNEKEKELAKNRELEIISEKVLTYLEPFKIAKEKLKELKKNCDLKKIKKIFTLGYNPINDDEKLIKDIIKHILKKKSIEFQLLYDTTIFRDFKEFDKEKKNTYTEYFKPILINFPDFIEKIYTGVKLTLTEEEDIRSKIEKQNSKLDIKVKQRLFDYDRVLGYIDTFKKQREEQSSEA